MAVTTTYQAIRDNYVTLIEALSPTKLSQLAFRRGPQAWVLREWAQRTGSASLRKFEFRITGGVSDPHLFDPSALERNEEITLTVAYPVEPGLYGATDLDEVEAVMRSDAHQLRDLIFSGTNYLGGQSAAFVEIDPPDRALGTVWFQTLRITLIYLESQSLT